MEKQLCYVSELKEYVLFLRNNYLDKLVEENIKRAKEIKLPLLQFFRNYTERELYKYARIGLIHFLNHLNTGRGLEEVEGSIRLWKANSFPGVLRDEISVSDIVLVHNVRKYSLIKLLPLYTDDFHLQNSIILELEDFYMKVTELTFQAYVDMQKGKLMEEKEFIEILINNSIDGILAFDDNFRFTAWNKQLEYKSGIKKEYVIGQQVFNLFPYFRNANEENKLHEVLKGKKVYFPPEYYPNEKRYLEINVVPLKNNKEEIFGGLAIIHDVTGIKKAEEKVSETKDELKKVNNGLEKKVKKRTSELQEAIEKLNRVNVELTNKNQELVKTNNDLDNFIYTASHDLKAPICNLEGLMITLLAEIDVNESLQPIAKMMNHSLERFKNTIKELTEISRVQKEKVEDEDEVRFDVMAEEVCQYVKDFMNVSNVDILSEFNVESLKFSKKNFRSILYNLISNALKYSYEGRKPVIKLRTKKEEGYICLTVEDNGIGIKEIHRGKIFQMFKRAHDHVEGSGIGLYIVKRIIDNSGGKIEVTSTVGAGSIFRVYFKSNS